MCCETILQNTKLLPASTEGSAVWKYGLVEVFFQKYLARKPGAGGSENKTSKANEVRLE